MATQALHIAQLIQATKDIHSVKLDIEHIKDILREHGAQLRELYRVASSSSTKAELNVAVQVISMPTCSTITCISAPILIWV